MIIDFECDTPTLDVAEETVRLIHQGRGFDKEGYAQLMAPGWAAQLGLTMDEFRELKASEGLTVIALRLCELHRREAMADDDVIPMLDDAGVDIACIGNAGRRASNEDVAKLAAQHPERLIPWFRIWGEEGPIGVRKLEEGVRELGCRGFEVSPYREMRYANDPVYWPFLAKCEELGIPARITVGMHLLSDRPHDFGHPRSLDELARQFPKLKIVAALGGWPWIEELCAIVLRHANLYVDFACTRVGQMLAHGGGYEAMVFHGQHALQDKILFASGWGSMGVSLKQMVAETEQLPLNDTVRRKWMGENAARVLGLD